MATTQDQQTTAAKSAFSWRIVTPMFLDSALNPVNSSLIATALVPIAAAMGSRSARRVSDLGLRVIAVIVIVVSVVAC